MTTLTTENLSPKGTDDAIVAAKGRYNEACAAFDATPLRKGRAAQHQALMEQIDAAEQEIRSSLAGSPAGVEIKLWVALGQGFIDKDAIAAARKGDLGWFDAREEAFDPRDRMVLSAIRSLRSIAGAKSPDVADTLESAAADISLALTFMVAADRFSATARRFVKSENDATLNALLDPELKRAATLIDEARSKLEASMRKLDLVIDAEYGIAADGSR